MILLPLLILTLGIGTAFAAFDPDGSSEPPSNMYMSSESSLSQSPLVASTDNAAFVRQNVPTRMVVGQTTSVSITMRNSGSTMWTRAAGYKLGSENPRDN
jgi:hypothetical protein